MIIKKSLIIRLLIKNTDNNVIKRRKTYENTVSTKNTYDNSDKKKKIKTRLKVKIIKAHA